ncbi:MAG: hypothetical protein GX022_06990 [Clostridiaceae bacterium]|nr:hypothetical protein [Clostridiaceae bacterium]
MSENILIILATGINANKSENIFKDFKDEIRKRYILLGKTVKFAEIFPLGEVRHTTVVRQILEVGVHIHRGTGGKEIVRYVKNNSVLASRIILIGHSGGGQAVGDALVTLERMGIPIYHVVQIGAPAVPVHKKYVHKVTRVETRTDFVSRNIHIGTEAISYGINPISGLLLSFVRLFNRKMPETRYVELNINGQKWGGHSAYFKRNLKNKYGIDNVTITVNAFWDKIR